MCFSHCCWITDTQTVRINNKLKHATPFLNRIKSTYSFKKFADFDRLFRIFWARICQYSLLNKKVDTDCPKKLYDKLEPMLACDNCSFARILVAILFGEMITKITLMFYTNAFFYQHWIAYRGISVEIMIREQYIFKTSSP